MDKEEFDVLIETICRNGCLDVTRTIMLLEKGESPSKLQHLNYSEHQAILKELKSIMDIYDGEVCSI
jgi:hypothetical protein